MDMARRIHSEMWKLTLIWTLLAPPRAQCWPPSPAGRTTNIQHRSSPTAATVSTGHGRSSASGPAFPCLRRKRGASTAPLKAAATTSITSFFHFFFFLDALFFIFFFSLRDDPERVGFSGRRTLWTTTSNFLIFYHFFFCFFVDLFLQPTTPELTL